MMVSQRAERRYPSEIPLPESTPKTLQVDQKPAFSPAQASYGQGVDDHSNDISYHSDWKHHLRCLMSVGCFEWLQQASIHKLPVNFKRVFGTVCPYRTVNLR